MRRWRVAAGMSSAYAGSLAVRLPGPCVRAGRPWFARRPLKEAPLHIEVRALSGRLGRTYRTVLAQGICPENFPTSSSREGHGVAFAGGGVGSQLHKLRVPAHQQKKVSRMQAEVSCCRLDSRSERWCSLFGQRVFGGGRSQRRQRACVLGCGELEVPPSPATRRPGAAQVRRLFPADRWDIKVLDRQARAFAHAPRRKCLEASSYACAHLHARSHRHRAAHLRRNTCVWTTLELMLFARCNARGRMVDAVGALSFETAPQSAVDEEKDEAEGLISRAINTCCARRYWSAGACEWRLRVPQRRYQRMCVRRAHAMGGHIALRPAHGERRAERAELLESRRAPQRRSRKRGCTVAPRSVEIQRIGGTRPQQQIIVQSPSGSPVDRARRDIAKHSVFPGGVAGIGQTSGARALVERSRTRAPKRRFIGPPDG